MRAHIITLLLRLLACLPLRLNHALGGFIGRCLCLVPNSMRHISRINVARCLPELDARQQQELVCRSLIEAGKTLTETGPLWFWDWDKIRTLLHEPVGEAEVHQAFAEGKGLILVTPHLGSWEISGLWAATEFPMTTLYRPPRAAELDQLIRQVRGRLGATMAPTDSGGIRALYKALGNGGAVGLLPDQEPGRFGGVFAPFFGIPAYTMVLLSRLARKSGAPVFFVYGQRLPKGAGYRMVFRRGPDSMQDEDLNTSVAAMNSTLETLIREQPEQYQWGYRRFRTRPDDEKDAFYASSSD